MFNKPIFGVGPAQCQAVSVATTRQQDTGYLPESRMTEQMIRGVEWEPYRVDASGEQWYRRAGESAVEIHSEADIDDIDFDDEAPERTTDEILADFNRECQLIKARHARGELVGSDDDIGTDDIYGDFGDDDE